MATMGMACHGNWGEGGQNLQCTVKEILLDSYFITQVSTRAFAGPLR